VTLKTWDGSISLLTAADGGPAILYDAQDGKQEGLGDSPILGVARLVDPADRYLQLWARAPNNPVNFTGTPIAFPSQIWRNGDHFNFVGQGMRFASTDPTLHAWTNMGEFVDRGEHSGQWWAPTPNQADGSPPPPGTPNHVVNVNGGADYLFGQYFPGNESFISSGQEAHLEGGRADWWGGQGGADNNGRMMIVGWAMPDYTAHPAGPGINFLTRLTLVREVNYDAALGSLVSNPLPELAGLRNGTLASERGVPLAAAPHVVPGTAGGAASSADVNVTFTGFVTGSNVTASFGACVLAGSGVGGDGLGVAITVGPAAPPTSYYMPGVDLPGGDYNVTNVAYSDPHICQAACTADGARCVAYTYVTRPPLVGSCCLKHVVDVQRSNPTCTSGVKATGPAPPAGSSAVSVRVGTCAEAMAWAAGAPAPALAAEAASFPLLNDTAVTLRVLPDRSVADFFVQGGRWAGTVTWNETALPRAAAESTVTLWATTAGISADVDVHSMGCGWVDPSYTEHPTM